MEYITAALDDALPQHRTENPLEAWTRFVDTLDVNGRRHIGDKLEAQGCNRYTGEVVTK